MPARRNYYEEGGVIYLQCKGCGEYKSSDNFYKHKICFMGLSSICKDCNHKHGVAYHTQHRDEDNRKRREWREANKDVINADKRSRYASDIEYRKLCSDRSKERREDNREANLKHHKEYYYLNKDAISERHKKYYERNREYINERNRIYSETHRDLINKAASIWKKNNRDKMNIYQQGLRARRGPKYSQAHRLVEKQLKKLGLKWLSCPICGKGGTIVCHHPDYNKPYEVVPCCNKCHHDIHKGVIDCSNIIIDLLKR